MIDRVGVLSFFSRVTIERAKDAIDIANVGVIRIRVDDERNPWLGIFPEADFIRQPAEIEQFGVVKEKQTFFSREALLGLDFCVDG